MAAPLLKTALSDYYKLPFLQFEPPTPDNPYAHTNESVWASFAYDGHSWASYQLGLQNDFVNLSTSSAEITVLAGDGDDMIATGQGNDKLYGQDGNDALNSGVGDDLVLGGAGNDLINGGSGSDTLWGGAGNDTVIGGTGNDAMWGGSGSDTFVVDFGYSFTRHLPGGQGSYVVNVNTIDTINDFNAKFDAIDLAIAGSASNYHEAALSNGQHGLDAAQALGEQMLAKTGDLYAFVTDGADGYLFVDRGDGLDTGVTVLKGLDSVSDFDWHNII
jgi:Ca2+-binding RTX toxin-like protein